MMFRLTLILFALFLSHCIHAQTEIPLYDTIPNSKPAPDQESSETTEGILRIKKVSLPTLTIYRPSVPSPKKTAVIICPGGGYAILAASHEGSDVAKVLAGWGITAIVLKYRLPDDAFMINKSIGPLQDAQRAIQLARYNAAVWNIDPNRIGIMGFSAGGHLAATASTHFDKPVVDSMPGISIRPDFSVLVYPVISFTNSLAHMGSRENLLGKHAIESSIAEFSNEQHVSANTPPAFLVHANDDRAVKAENSKRYYKALLKNKVAAELRLYPAGGHGFGMNNKSATDQWMDHLRIWMKARGFL